MVEDRHVHRLAHEGQAPRDPFVSRARGRIAAGVIVGENDAAAAVAGGIADDLADREVGAVDLAVVAGQMDAARIIVDMRDPEMLLVRIDLRQAAGEEAAGGVETVQAQRGFGTLMEHAANLCEGARFSDLKLVRNSHPFRMESAGGERMETQDTVFSGSIPAIYDRYMVPLIFAPYAELVGERVARLRPERILETAAGTGVVTQAMHRALPEADIVVTDLNEPMLEQAARRVRATNLRFQPADAQALPFEDGSFDLVVCQFGIMFFPDKVRANSEARRVLRDGGDYLLVIWDSIERNLATRAAGRAVADLVPDEAARFYERVPFRYHDPAQIERDLRAAGFERIEIETVERRSRAASARDAAIALVQGTPMRADIEQIDSDLIGPATDVAAQALAQFEGPDGFDAPMSAHLVIATK